VRAQLHYLRRDSEKAIEDFTTVIGLPGAPVEQVAIALVSRGGTHHQAGDTQRAIEDFTAVIGLPGAPVEQVGNALVCRGIAYGQVGDTQRAIEDFTAVIGLTGDPVDLVADALYARGITYFERNQKAKCSKGLRCSYPPRECACTKSGESLSGPRETLLWRRPVE